MPLVPVGFARITMQFARDGDSNPFDMTFGVKLATGDITPEEAATEVANAWDDSSSLRGICPSNVTLRQVHAQKGNDGPPLVGTITSGQAGLDSSGALMPPNVAIVGKKLTAFGGQHWRGRMYVPWCKEAQADDAGVLTSGAITAYEDRLNFMLANLGTGALDGMYLLHSTNPLTPTIVANIIVRPKVGSQKRRLHL